jgi:hypothetical protein
MRKGGEGREFSRSSRKVSREPAVSPTTEELTEGD